MSPLYARRRSLASSLPAGGECAAGSLAGSVGPRDRPRVWYLSNALTCGLRRIQREPVRGTGSLYWLSLREALGRQLSSGASGQGMGPVLGVRTRVQHCRRWQIALRHIRRDDAVDIQSPRVNAQVCGRVTNRQNPEDSSRTLTSLDVSRIGHGGVPETTSRCRGCRRVGPPLAVRKGPGSRLCAPRRPCSERADWDPRRTARLPSLRTDAVAIRMPALRE